MAPLFERIPRVKWITSENSSHIGHFEERVTVDGDFRPLPERHELDVRCLPKSSKVWDI